MGIFLLILESECAIEKAKIKIGDRVPVISTTQNTISNTSSDSVQYLDVGLNVDIEPNIRINGEINIKLGMEVSNVVWQYCIRGHWLPKRMAAQMQLLMCIAEQKVLVKMVFHSENGETAMIGLICICDDRERGFTYLAVLFCRHWAVGLSSVGMSWHTAQRIEREKQLLFVVNQFRQAIKAFYNGVSGVHMYPTQLQDLLEDPRQVEPRRYLRKIYLDPLRDERQWGIIKAPVEG